MISRLSSLATLLPLLFLAGLFQLLLRTGAKYTTATLNSAIIGGIIVAVGTEVLSFFKIVTYEALLIFWMFSLGIILIAKPLLPNNRSPLHLPLILPQKNLPLMLTGGLGIIIITGLTAIISPPNNFDSITYHLPRIIHWMQNQSVEHYQTNITRQLYSGPWAEYLLLHLHLLSGSDRFANLLQWSAMLGTMLVIAMIVREIEGNSKASLYASLLCASIPMGILQASSTQNDYVTTFWLACFIWGSLLPRKRVLGSESILTGCSLGLAILSKGTAYPLAFPFLLWMLIRDMRSAPVRAVGRLLFVLSLILVINSGHYLRNTRTFGNPISTAGDRLANEAPGVRSMSLNMVRNMAMQFASPFTGINHLLEKGVNQYANGIGADPNNPKTFLVPFTLRPLVQFHEDFAVNPLHTLLIILTLLLVLTQKSLRRKPLLFEYTLTLLAAFMLFSLLLKWQPFASRLLLPLIILWMPASAIVLSIICRGRTAGPIILVFLVCSLPWLFFNTSRPLLMVPAPLMFRLAPGIIPLRSILASDRIEQYYANKPEFRPSQERVAKILVERGCTSVGLLVNNDYWEYTLWVQMQQQGKAVPRIEHLSKASTSQSAVTPIITAECQLFSGKDNITYLTAENH